jgi:hypothetical protein
MRKLLSLMLVAAMGIILLGSCERLGIKSPGDNYDTSDSVNWAEYVNRAVNPSIMDITEALSLKQQMLEKQSIDSAFVSLSDATIKNVVSVLLKKNSFIHKVDIVEEYLRCQNVYDNLPSDTKVSDVDKTGTDLGTRPDTGSTSANNGGNTNRVLSNSYSYRTDTINGKPVRVRIQKIETYE